MEMSIGPLHSGQDRRGRDREYQLIESSRRRLTVYAHSYGFEKAVTPWFDPKECAYFFMTHTRITMGPYRCYDDAASAFLHNIDLMRQMRAEDEEAERRRNDLLTEQEVELVDLIQEECGEVIQARSKLRRNGDRKSFIALRFERDDPNGKTNLQDLETELFDVLTLICEADERGLIDLNRFPAHQQVKLERLARFTDIFREPGEPTWLERLGVE